MEVLGSNNEFLEYIVELNTENQLFDKGVDSKGRLLDEIGGGYSPYTIELKKAKGQPTDRVTLKDTGDFYRSFKAFLDSGKDITIYADAIKDTTDLVQEWGANIIGLNKDSLILLKNKSLQILLPYIRKKLLNG